MIAAGTTARTPPIASTSNKERATLAAWLSGRPAVVPDDGREAVSRLLAVATAEGVVALAHDALARRDDVSATLRDAFAAAIREGAAGGMLRTAECRRILAAMADAGIPVLLLKGQALGAWLYPRPYLRESSDIDLLFASRADAERGAELLASSGYAMRYRAGRFAHEFVCRRKAGAMAVDLDAHWRLSAMPVFREALAFDELDKDAIALPALDKHARGLGPMHAFVHACIHRASNVCSGIGDRLKWLYDLHLLAERLDGDDWSRLLYLSRERGLCGVVAEAIEATAAAFGPVVPEHVIAALEAGRIRERLDASRLRDWDYIQRQNLRALPTLSLRVRWLWQRVFPPHGYMRESYGDDLSVPGLWLERVRRAFGRLLGRRAP